MLKQAVIVAFALALTVPALAQPVEPQTDKLLWCGSAFYWLAASAEDSGESEEAEMYDRWSKRLLEVGSAALTSAGHTPESVESLITAYDTRALSELAATDAPHDITTCPELLGDWR